MECTAQCSVQQHVGQNTPEHATQATQQCPRQAHNPHNSLILSDNCCENFPCSGLRGKPFVMTIILMLIGLGLHCRIRLHHNSREHGDMAEGSHRFFQIESSYQEIFYMKLSFSQNIQLVWESLCLCFKVLRLYFSDLIFPLTPLYIAIHLVYLVKLRGDFRRFSRLFNRFKTKTKVT